MRTSGSFDVGGGVVLKVDAERDGNKLQYSFEAIYAGAKVNGLIFTLNPKFYEELQKMAHEFALKSDNWEQELEG